ncbi:MAG: hypothetical protein AAF721_42045, partial [Myxococcota bacterium]
PAAAPPAAAPPAAAPPAAAAPAASAPAPSTDVAPETDEAPSAEADPPDPAAEVESSPAAVDEAADAADAAADEAATSPAAAQVAVTPAPQPEYLDVPINVGLFPSVSVNGSHHGHKLKNRISASIGWSRVAKLDGVAIAGAATIVDEEARGLTWSFGANIARGSHHGMQSTYGYNHADVLRGVQAGAVNHARDAKGVQFGMLNLGGTVRGVQFGLINYAEEADASFALLPITKKGGVRPDVWSSDTALLNVGIRLPANYTYAFLAAGLHPIGHRGRPNDVVLTPVGEEPAAGQGRAMQIGAGFGGHLPVREQGFIDADVAVYGVTSGLDLTPPFANLVKLRLMGGWQAAKRLALYGGPTLNVMVDDASRPVARPGYGWVAHTEVADGYRIRIWPGFAAGLRF